MKWREMLQQLTSFGATAEPEMAASERRATWRVVCKVGLFGTFKDGANINMVAVNLGPGGMCLQTPKPFPKGAQIHLRFPMRRDLPAVRVRVIWCNKRKLVPGYEMGVAYESSSSDVHDFLAECGVRIRSGKEQRKSPRLAVHHLNIKGYLATPDGEMSDITVVDLAVGGALLLADRELPQESTFQLKIILARDLPSFDTHAVVMRCREGMKPGTWMLGVNFMKVPPEHRDRLISFLSRLLKEK